MIQNMTDQKYTSQVGEIICEFDIKNYFQKFDSFNMNKGSKRIQPIGLTQAVQQTFKLPTFNRQTRFVIKIVLLKSLWEA